MPSCIGKVVKGNYAVERENVAKQIIDGAKAANLPIGHLTLNLPGDS